MHLEDIYFEMFELSIGVLLYWLHFFNHGFL